MTILLTGATGFLGSHLLGGLLNNGFSVVVLKRTWSDTSRIDHLLPEIVAYDIDKTPLRIIFEAHAIEAVLHTATCYGRKGEKVSEIIDANLTLPLAVLELGAEFKIDTFFNTDTALPKDLDYYTLSKKHLLEYGCRLAQASDIRFTNVRLEHMYGPGDDSNKFIPFLIRAFLGGKETLDLTAGEQRRDFIYLDDVVAAYLTLLEHRSNLVRPLTTFELGTGEAPLLADVVKMIHSLCESRTELRFGALPYRHGEVMHSQAHVAPLARLGWSPRVSLSEGLTLTVEAEKRNAVR